MSASLLHASSAVREPILDASGAPYGFELSAGSGTAAILEYLRTDEAATLARRRALFLPPHEDWFAPDVFAGLECKSLVVQLATVPGDDAAHIAGAVPALKALCARGVRIALPRAALKNVYAPWLELAAFVKLDAEAVSPQQFDSLLGFLQRQTRVQAIASNVESQQTYERLRTIGVPLFQGRWFAHVSPDPRGSLRPAQAVVIQLINMLQRDADVDEIAPLLKRDPSLSFNLLRMINSAASGLSFEVTSLQHAMMLMGQKRLFRWAASLMAMARPEGSAPALAHSAMMRGRLMELLAAELLPPEDGDAAFVCGVFSLLDALLDMPMAAALDSLALPEAVADALLRGTGLLAPFLALTKACEADDEAEFARAAEALHLSNHQVNWAHLQALAWAEELVGSW